MHIPHDKVLSDEEVEKLLAWLHSRVVAVAPGHTTALLDELIVAALLSSGLRNSEFCALTLADTVIGTGQSVFVVRRPSPRKRAVYVPRCVSDLIERYVKEVRPRFLYDEIDENDLTAPMALNENRRPFDRTTLYRRVVRILTEAGLGDRANVQLLRHTYGYLAYLRTGGNLLFVQRQLGHAHIATTSAYADFVKESYPDLAERVLPEVQQRPAVEKVFTAARQPRFNCEVD